MIFLKMKIITDGRYYMEQKSNIEFILGGARSGKSAFAEQQAIASNLPVIFVATAMAQDDEMAKRIAKHQSERPLQWALVEEQYNLAQVITDNSTLDNCLIIDCLTLWLSNCLFEPSIDWPSQKFDFLTALINAPGQILLVSNEVGQGIVPIGEITRKFVDEAGWLHQEIAAKVNRVSFITAGLVQQLKG